MEAQKGQRTKSDGGGQVKAASEALRQGQKDTSGQQARCSVAMSCRPKKCASPNAP